MIRMKALSRGAVLLFVALVAGFAQTALGSKGPPVTASCSDAVYTTAASAPPKPVMAVRIGPAVFNSLANLRTERGLDKPSKELPFYTVKLPLTILAQAKRGVIITVTGGELNAALLYNPEWLRRLASPWHYRFDDLPRSVRLTLCSDSQTKLLLNTQYPGGFLLRKPGCITIQVQAIGDTAAHRATVPVGVRHC